MFLWAISAAAKLSFEEKFSVSVCLSLFAIGLTLFLEESDKFLLVG